MFTWLCPRRSQSLVCAPSWSGAYTVPGRIHPAGKPSTRRPSRASASCRARPVLAASTTQSGV
eukprot:10288796-Alexandrium_andersonii.AAC.1